MFDELDYRLEAAQPGRVRPSATAGHPFVRVPAVVTERSAERVLTSEWVDGRTWSQFEGTASAEQRQLAGEVLFRFAQRLASTTPGPSTATRTPATTASTTTGA